MTGFFEETPGVRSMGRLLAFCLMVLDAIMVLVVAFYTVRTKDPQSGVIMAFGTIIVPLAVQGMVAIVKRGAPPAGESPS